MEGIIAGYNLYTKCQKCDGDRASILPSLSVEQYEQFVLSSASRARQYLLQHIVDYPTRRYNTLPLCELAALCPFYLPRALEHIQETPQDLTLWLEAIRNGNLDRRTYATLFRILSLLLSKSQSYKDMLVVVESQMSILHCRISRLGFTLPLLATTRIFTEHLMEGDPWHNRIRDLKMVNSRFSTMVPSLEEFEQSCVLLHSVQKVIPLGNRYLPGSFGTADEVVDMNFEISPPQLQAARNVIEWMETHDDWFHQLQPSLAIPTDLAEFQTYLTTSHARIRAQYILHRLSNEGFYSRQWLLLLYTLAALCPLWFPTAGAGGDLILLLHAFHTNEMTPTSFKVLHQILSITTFHNPPSELAEDLQTIQKRSQWTDRNFEESLASAISYFQEMFQFRGQFYGMVVMLAVTHQVKSIEPWKSIATLLRVLKYLQEYRISNSSEDQELFLESLRTHSFQCPSASTLESMSSTSSTSHNERLSVLPSSKSATTGYRNPWEECRKSFEGRSPSETHCCIHTNKRPYYCVEPNCNKRFAQKCALKVHLRVHTGEKPFVCDYVDCGKAFSDSSGLTKHRRIHNPKQMAEKRLMSPKWPCDQCGKSFRQKGDFNRHNRIHTDDRPHHCTEPGCDRRFIQRSALTLHLRSHTGEKPFLCDYQNCDKAYQDKSSLNRHRAIHDREQVPTLQTEFTP